MTAPLLLLLATLFQAPADAILGRWEGTSTCVRAEWNRACRDEVTRYDFVRDSAHPGVILGRAYKKVGEAWEEMGELSYRYDAATHRWVAGFTGGRGSIEWIFWIEGAELRGKVETLPDRRKGRDVVAHR